MFLFLIAPAVSSQELSPKDLPVESYILVETLDINTRIITAAEKGEEWPNDPISIAIEYSGSLKYRYVNIEKSDNVESPNNTIVTIIRGGMEDDSVWGTWEQLRMTKNSEGIWLVDEARRAWRCYRGYQIDSFGKRYCL